MLASRNWNGISNDLFPLVDIGKKNPWRIRPTSKQWSTMAAKRTTWKALGNIIMDGGWQHLINSMIIICLGVWEFACLLPLGFFGVSCICGLLHFILENSWSLCLQIFFSAPFSFLIYKQCVSIEFWKSYLFLSYIINELFI